MTPLAAAMTAHADATPATAPAAGSGRRALVIGIIGFLTLIDLFAAQAILPSLARHYGVAPGMIGIAANAGTIGMAVAALAAGALGGRLERRAAIALSLALLAIPTTLLAVAPNLLSFAALRIVQGLCMATAFTLALAYLGERCSREEATTALAAFVTGVVASNLIGRLLAAFVVSNFGLEANFGVLAALNLGGALLAWRALDRVKPAPATDEARVGLLAALALHLKDARLRAAFAVGALILFAFVGVFTYVNFVLAAPPFALSPMALGLVYLVFLPAMLTTPPAGRLALRWGVARAGPAALMLALVGALLLLAPSFAAVLAGLALLGVGTFFAQAAATGFVARTASTERVAASGLYLASYYAGGLVGAAALGQLFDALGWGAVVAGVVGALALAALLARGLREP
jgi:YNFM family putative membrane transporter